MLDPNSDTDYLRWKKCAINVCKEFVVLRKRKPIYKMHIP